MSTFFSSEVETEGTELAAQDHWPKQDVKPVLVRIAMQGACVPPRGFIRTVPTRDNGSSLGRQNQISHSFQNVIESPLVKEILTFKSHRGAWNTIFFLIMEILWCSTRQGCSPCGLHEF